MRLSSRRYLSFCDLETVASLNEDVSFVHFVYNAHVT